MTGRVRRDGWLVAVPLTPLVLVGLALTASLFGAVFGIPILVLALRPWWVASRIGRGRGPADGITPSVAVHVGLCAAVVAVTYVASAVVGLDDLDSVEDAGLWLLLTLMVAALVVGSVRLILPVVRARADGRRR